nr:DUF2272 domain-containing protein [Stenotrophomonas mori]
MVPAGADAATEVCDLPPRYGTGAAARALVHATCNEHRLWHRAFIDREGRIAHLPLTEAETGMLADDGLVAWQRVAGYWRDSGLLPVVAALPGATSCQRPPGDRAGDNDCRAFLVDTPWSAAFIAWIMARAGIPGFTRSPRHIDYIRAAHRDGAAARPYRLADPFQDRPAPGDLLCFLRGRSAAAGPAGLREALDSGGAERWTSHCEIVVAANPGGDRTLHLVGGNVANAVVMRRLPLTRTGQLEPAAASPTDALPWTPSCSPANETACDLNRQDWAALLKLVEPPPVSPPMEPATGTD